MSLLHRCLHLLCCSCILPDQDDDAVAVPLPAVSPQSNNNINNLNNNSPGNKQRLFVVVHKVNTLHCLVCVLMRTSDALLLPSRIKTANLPLRSSHGHI